MHSLGRALRPGMGSDLVYVGFRFVYILVGDVFQKMLGVTGLRRDGLAFL